MLFLAKKGAVYSLGASITRIFRFIFFFPQKTHRWHYVLFRLFPGNSGLDFQGSDFVFIKIIVVQLLYVQIVI